MRKREAVVDKTNDEIAALTFCPRKEERETGCVDLEYEMGIWLGFGVLGLGMCVLLVRERG